MEILDLHSQIRWNTTVNMHEIEGHCGYIYNPLKYPKDSKNAVLKIHLKRNGLVDFTDDTMKKNIFLPSEHFNQTSQNETKNLDAKTSITKKTIYV